MPVWTHGGESGRCNTRRACYSYLRLISSYRSFFGGGEGHIDSKVKRFEYMGIILKGDIGYKIFNIYYVSSTY
jgi:hypothetical protein